MSRYYTMCWKCENYIKSAAECNYLKTRDGNYSLCSACYEFFLRHNIEILRPERSKREELERSLHTAIEQLHNELTEQISSPIWRTGSGLKGAQALPTVLFHLKGWWGDCDVCKEILSMRCSEHCGNTVRDK